MSGAGDLPLAGGCACGQLRYRLTAAPMFVHCCHCSYCQRQTGSAFAVNALIERSHLDLLSGEPEPIELATPSGKGQRVFRCPECRIALWSHYAVMGNKVAFIRVGTLDEPQRCPPDVHIHTARRLPWVRLPRTARAFDAYYEPKQEWPLESRQRFLALKHSSAD